MYTYIYLTISFKVLWYYYQLQQHICPVFIIDLLSLLGNLRYLILIAHKLCTYYHQQN